MVFQVKQGIGEGGENNGWREGHRDKGNYVKINFGFNELRAKLPYQLKTHVKGVMLASLTTKA